SDNGGFHAAPGVSRSGMRCPLAERLIRFVDEHNAAPQSMEQREDFFQILKPIQGNCPDFLR
ncbi:MAG: hypothetical protein OSA48_06100, partial [Akkermansiaceae bacterium]|nr:hypothetical protein [Akkermansiaceae bacterium]